MKRFALLLLALFCLGLTPAEDTYLFGAKGRTFYVDSGSGADTNNGLSPWKAWQTCTKVNGYIFKKNDRVLFKGGATFSSGCGLVFTTTNSPRGYITVASYGTGQATVSSGNSSECVKATNVPAVAISNITCTGGGNFTNTTAGISIVNSQSGNTKIGGPAVSSVTISGYGLSGILLQGTNAASGFNGFSITNNTVHDVTGGATAIQTACIGVLAVNNNPAAHIRGMISGNTVYNCTGAAGQAVGTGNGIFVQEATGVLITRNIAHDFGVNGFGAVGVWTADADRITVTYNESYNGKRASGNDGGGFDLDEGTTNSVASYNYSHDNIGYGFNAFMANSGGCCATWGNNTYSFNISQNNGDTEFLIAGSLNATGPLNVFNNTFYCGRSGGLCFHKNTSTTITAVVANNIFYGVGGANIVTAPTPSSMTFSQNNYRAPTGNAAFSWNGSSYASLALWQAGTSQDATGTTTDPQIYVPGGGFVAGGYVPAKMMAYNPQAGSPVINAGINIQTSFSLNPGVSDFFGNAVTASALPIGAGNADFGSFAASCTQASTFLALTSSFTKADNVNYNSWICGSQSDGDLALMDMAYLLAAPNHAAMLLDVSGNSHTLTENGTVTFTARTGAKSNGTTGYLDTGWLPSSGPNLTLNSGTVAGYDVTPSSAVASFLAILGVENAGATAEIALAPKAGVSAYVDINDETGRSPNVPTASGFSMGQRIAGPLLTFYKNGVSLGSTSPAAVSVPNRSMAVLGDNAGGGLCCWMTDNIGLVFAGSGAISPANTALRAQSFMQAYGINVY